MREHEGEVHRREPDLGAALVLPIAARICIKRHANHATEMAGERSPDSAPNRVEPSTGRKEGRPTDLVSRPSQRQRGSQGGSVSGVLREARLLELRQRSDRETRD